jgi:hypothetical protein
MNSSLLILPLSPRCWYALWERDLGRLGDAGLCTERTRVRRSLPPLGACRPNECCSENRDKTETLLAFGASRLEACRPLAVNALRLALMPTINQMRCVARVPLPSSIV